MSASFAPVMPVEYEESTAVESRDQGKLDAMPLPDFIARATKEISLRR